MILTVEYIEVANLLIVELKLGLVLVVSFGNLAACFHDFNWTPAHIHVQIKFSVV